MSTHAFLNLLNKLRKRDKSRGFDKQFITFCNKFNKFNNTGAQILEFIYNMTVKLFEYHAYCG